MAMMKDDFSMIKPATPRAPQREMTSAEWMASQAVWVQTILLELDSRFEAWWLQIEETCGV